MCYLRRIRKIADFVKLREIYELVNLKSIKLPITLNRQSRKK